MKKILLAAVAALAIVGCSQNEEIEKAGEKAEINVGTVVKTGTKAVVTDNGNFNAFTVKAYVVEEANIVNPEKPDVPLNKNDAFQKVQKRRVQEKR